jgi:hypothetical protein
MDSSDSGHDPVVGSYEHSNEPVSSIKKRGIFCHMLPIYVSRRILLSDVSSTPSFPSALQLRASFGLLNNLPPFFSIRHQSSPISVQSIHPRLIIWFLNNLVFTV